MREKTNLEKLLKQRDFEKLKRAVLPLFFYGFILVLYVFYPLVLAVLYVVLLWGERSRGGNSDPCDVFYLSIIYEFF